MKKQMSNIIVGILFSFGLALLLYPSVSNYWNDMHQTKVITNYVEKVDKIDEETYQKIFGEANDYNQSLIRESVVVVADEEKYNRILNINGGQIGYIQIPTINVSLPIYHGTSEAVLQVGIGHVAGSSFPIGEEGSHTVLLGHRGLPSAKLFTNLPKLKEKDLFYITVFDKKITYEVDDIKVVKPERLEDIIVEEEGVYVTLVTCTPYAINSHRLLVRGHKIEVNEPDEEITPPNNWISSLIWFVIIILILLFLLLIIIFYKKKKNKDNKNNNKKKKKIIKIKKKNNKIK